MKYILFGAGAWGQSYCIANPSSFVAYFCDNDSQKWGKEFCDKQVLSPQQLLEIFDPEQFIIVITTLYAPSIRAQLLKMGIEHFSIYQPETRAGFSQEDRELWFFAEQYADEQGRFHCEAKPFFLCGIYELSA